MKVSYIGNFHKESNCNNQDHFLETDKLMMVVDGCSGGLNSEVGAKLFTQIFSMQEDFENLDKFEQNVDKTMKQLLSIVGVKPLSELTKEQYNFIMENYFFTIIACFKQESGFVVKALGDGYILTQNRLDCISFIKLEYGKYPPYIMYNFLKDAYKGGYFSEKLEFKTFRFSKENFKNIGIATDGLQPVADVLTSPSSMRKEKNKLEAFLINADALEGERKNIRILNLIKRNTATFFDDITIVFSEEDK